MQSEMQILHFYLVGNVGKVIMPNPGYWFTLGLHNALAVYYDHFGLCSDHIGCEPVEFGFKLAFCK